MSAIVVLAWLGLLALLVKLNILKGWAGWMKISPVAIYILTQFLFIVPMGFSTPSGSVVVLKHSVQIVPSVSGVITEVPVESGVELQKGDVLFKIDPTVYQSTVDQLEAQQVVAQQNMERQQQIAKINPDATSAAEAQRLAAELKQVTAELVAARWYLEQTTVQAPSVGFVTSSILRPGARVVENSSQVMAFVDESQQMIAAQIEQINLRNIEVGQPAEVIFKVNPGKVFEARVVLVVRANASGMLSPSDFELATSTIEAEPYWVELKLTDESISLPPGAVGTVAIYSGGSGVTTSIRKIVLRMENWTNYLF